MFGLSTDTLRNLRGVLAQDPHIEKTLMYGSRAKGNYKTGSDIDITLIGKGLTLTDTIYPLRDRLRKLYLPYKFDISIFNQLDEGDVIEHVLRVGKTLYQRVNGAGERWRSTQLSNICDILDHLRKPITKKDRIKGFFPYYGATGLLDHVDGYIFNEPLVLVGEDGAKWESGENSAFVIEGKCWVNNHAHVLRPHRNVVLDSWLIYFLNHSDLTPFVTGLTVPKLNQGKLKEIPIPIPSLSAQKQIVKILDEAFAAIDTAIANTKQNIANARELFQSQLEHAFTGNSVVERWPATPLVGACLVFMDGDWIEKKDQSPSGIRLIQTSNVGVGRFENRLAKARYISTDTFGDLKCTKILAGDCLVSRLPDPVGRSCIIPDTGERMITAVDCTIIRFKKNVLLPEFFKYYSQSRSYLSLVGGYCTGATRLRISRKNLGKIPIPLPPLSEQKQIVENLDKASANSVALVRTGKQKLAHLAELKQSLLCKSFTGELTADSRTDDRLLSKADV